MGTSEGILEIDGSLDGCTDTLGAALGATVVVGGSVSSTNASVGD